MFLCFFFSSRRRHTRSLCDWSSDVCSSDLARERLQTLGYVSGLTDVVTDPGSQLPDPKDKREIVERYRSAVDLAGVHKWPQAVGLLRQILRNEPELAGVWDQLAVFAIRADRWDQAIDAYKHFI